MNIEGLDYNTQREKLIMPEYGREVQDMVDLCVNLKTKEERQACAETIIAIMERMFPQGKESGDYQHKLWDHLAIMSDFKLDIDWSYDISAANRISSKPEPMPYPMERIPVRHYGHILFEVFQRLKTMPEGEERDELIRLTANQMKIDLMTWSHGSADDVKVADDLARFTDGKVQLDLNSFVFNKIADRPIANTPNKRKKK